MEKHGQIGFGFPIVCARHPDQVKIISEPGQLPKVAPLGTSGDYTTDAYLHPRRWLRTSMRVQAFLWTYMPFLGEDYFYSSSSLPLLSHSYPVSCRPRQPQENAVLREMRAIGLYTSASLRQAMP